MKGNFCVTKGAAGFTSITPDRGIEHENRKLKVTRGIVGITQNEKALDRYLLIAPEVAKLVDEFEQQYRMNSDVCRKQYHEITGGKLAKVTKNAAKLKQVIVDHGHPFLSDETDLYNILTKEVIDEKISKEILERDKIGQNMFKEFVKERTADGKVSIWSPMKRRNIGTFKNANAVSDMKAGDKLIKIKEERGLLQRFIVAARSRPDLDLKECIGKYEFRLIPRSLFASDGSLLLAYDKAKVLNHLEALIKDGEQVLQGGENGAPVEGRSLAAELQNTEIEGRIEGDQESYKVLLIDAMALVNSINKTDQIIYCSDFANAFIEKLINISVGYNEVRLVFDQYKDSSLKEQMRKKRTKGKSTYYRIQDNSMIRNITLKDFLSHVKTKKELAEYLATKTLVHSQSDQNRLNKFMVTAGTKTEGNTDVPENLANHSQEEADTLLLLHATTISDDAELTISSPDTDVFLQII